jgi:cell division transport system permease protein
MIKSIEDEAEISVYYEEGSSQQEVLNIQEEIRDIDGVKEILSVNEEEAKNKMNKILGKESRIISLFEHNPFSPYIEVKIDLESVDSIINEIEHINGVELVRDNKEILDKLISISSLVNIVGLFIVVAVSIATVVITSHIIQQGIYNNKEEIITLRLLGAPEFFITLPFILEGILMSILSGLLSIGMVRFLTGYLYSHVNGVLPFIVLPPFNKIIFGIGIFSLVSSFALGLLGSLFGLKSTKS